MLGILMHLVNVVGVLRVVARMEYTVQGNRLYRKVRANPAAASRFITSPQRVVSRRWSLVELHHKFTHSIAISIIGGYATNIHCRLPRTHNARQARCLHCCRGPRSSWKV